MANPFKQRDLEEEKAYKKMIISCIAAASLVVLLFLVVLYQNVKDKQKEEKRIARQIAAEEAKSEEDDFILEDKNIVSSDLDFWDMYDIDETPAEEEEEGETTPYKKGELKSDDKKTDSNSESLNKDPNKDYGTSDSSANDDKHLAVTDKNGNTMYYEILSNVDESKYDLEKNLITDDNGRKSYSDSDIKAVTGIDLSQNDGTIDFSKVKNEGINFAMLRIASRGYTTGVISLDEKFVEYANGCNSTGIYIGAYFTSQAINEQEAIEEASYAVGAVRNFNVKYPVAIDLSTYDQEDSRSYKLSMKDRTQIVKAFCDTVKQYGYKPIIRGTRDCLISKLNLEDLNKYDVWVLDDVQQTDYPYKYSIWQYTKNGKIDGIDMNVDISLSFVNYEDR